MYIWYGSLGEPTNENPKKQSKTMSNFLKKLWKASFVVSIFKFSSKRESSGNCGASLNIWIPGRRKKIESLWDVHVKKLNRKEEKTMKCKQKWKIIISNNDSSDSKDANNR